MIRSRPTAARGFSLLELMVTMGLASLLIGVGAGVYVKMGRRSAAMQAINSVGLLLKRAQNASTQAPATITAAPESGLLHAYTDVVLQELRFEPRPAGPGETAPTTPMGIQGRECQVTGGKLEPTGGNAGGCLRLDGGEVACGNYAAYDVDQGINVEMWVRPERPGTITLFSKGQALRATLRVAPAGPGDVRVAFYVQDKSGQQHKVEQDATIPQVRLNEWTGFRVSYVAGGEEAEAPKPAPGAEGPAAPSAAANGDLTIATSEGWGFVVRKRWTQERRPLARDPDEPLVLGSGLHGWIDDVRIGGIRSSEPLQLPVGVTFYKTNPPIRFVDGHLDPEMHRGPARLSIASEGRVHTFEIAQSGNLLAVHVADAEDAGAGEVPKAPQGVDPNTGAKRE